VDPDEYCHAELVLKAWFGGREAPKGNHHLQDNVIYNYKHQTFREQPPVMTALGNPDLHDSNLLHDFGFDLLPETESTDYVILLAVVLYLVRRSNHLFLQAC
jgi:hypothetical protein